MFFTKDIEEYRFRIHWIKIWTAFSFSLFWINYLQTTHSVYERMQFEHRIRLKYLNFFTNYKLKNVNTYNIK